MLALVLCADAESLAENGEEGEEETTLPSAVEEFVSATECEKIAVECPPILTLFLASPLFILFVFNAERIGDCGAYEGRRAVHEGEEGLLASGRIGS